MDSLPTERSDEGMSTDVDQPVKIYAKVATIRTATATVLQVA